MKKLEFSQCTQIYSTSEYRFRDVGANRRRLKLFPRKSYRYSYKFEWAYRVDNRVDSRF